jgi:5-methylcytosine-specific restriction endonuclease McrA
VNRPCISCGRVISRGSRCPPCTTAADAGRIRATAGRGNAAKLRREALERGPLSCWACGRPYAADALEAHHVQPLALGGADTLDNVRLACRPCHRKLDRRARVIAERNRVL